MDGIAELAKMFKDRENIPYFGPQTGFILSPPPNIQVALGEKIILSKDRLVIAEHLLSGYRREFQSTSSGTIITKTPPPVSYDTATVMESLNHDGEITFTDTLKAGDEVILIPSTNEQLYYLVGKAVRL
ncbi:MAG: hypothetical protein K0R93_1049 [Anaerosolibacter sp.]|jgi:hypothetical protein|uniref:DUF2577 domain-containing protein n=1 Tax=Anaerosolibacter sp. TaxID=1872527 RepID=UPI0026382832|nr:DUF2577 domain-containing protein [Anaerosolibacter sp.]MDF2546151.1 hypothetical protein [Anaerosolibacter sp.]